ncbi:signal peptide peptidase SppA [Desulfofustis limnaeus]|uniref:Protease n=1 Tax=Desulfofustis limnaeus TaxID=2740163 RepID=A0ABN6M2E8_9BACT|nr:signal peptide peptidase SppA [Desulfofustis limnaeus]BDD87056.1 protease [Desulfofustis limnaeus]
MKNLFRAIFNIFRGCAKVISVAWTIVFNLLFLGLIAVIVIAFLSRPEPTIPLNSILKLTISGDIVEQRRLDDSIDGYLSDLLGFSEEPRETLLQDIFDALEQARNDEAIRAVVLDLQPMGGAGFNQLQEIGSALIRFKQSGKPVVAMEDYYDQDQYFLAAHADTIFLNPMGGVNLHGFGLYRFYFQELLAKLKINFHVFQVGDYKSATEPLTRSSMSAEDRSQSREWLGELWQQYVATVAAQRQLTPEGLNAYINKIPANLRQADGDLARLAKDSGLVDQVQPRHEIERYLGTLAARDSDGTVRTVSLSTYLKGVDRSYQDNTGDQDAVALIVAQGTIMPGHSGPGTIGAESITALLRQARATSSIKAVVLRIDSGGGSAFASEVIRQEILQVRQSGKPVLVSMGGVAASGAYWIAANADEIWAAPSTITGSIGIFMAVPTFEQALAAAGIRRDGVGTANLAVGFDLSQPLSPELKEAIQLTLEHGYKTFRTIVAEGRNLDPQRVEHLAQGRVYSGRVAQELDLVDSLGSLEQTVHAAAARADLVDYRVTTLAEPLSLQERFFQRLGSKTLALVAQIPLFAEVLAGLSHLSPAVVSLPLFSDPNHLYAHCLLQMPDNDRGGWLSRR